MFGLDYTSSPLQSGATLAFTVLVSVGGVGDIDAATATGTGAATPLTLHMGGRVVMAKQGTIHVTDANLSARTWKGTIEAELVDGTHVAGGWACVAPL